MRIQERERKIVQEKRKRIQERLDKDEEDARKNMLNHLRKQAKWAHLDSRL